MTTEETGSEQGSSATHRPAENVITHPGADGSQQGQAKDINNKIDLLDNSLGELNAELETIRSSVEEGLDRLGDNDMDLTAKVSDTYKRLGEMDNTYRSLMDISSNIDREIQKLTGNISEVASHSTAELEKLEATTEIHTSYMTQQNRALVDRVNHLMVEYQQTTSRLNQGIQDVREGLLKAENKLARDIETLASASQKDFDALSHKLEVNDIEAQSSKARIIKLEKVDEALARRTGQLEVSMSEVATRSKALDESFGFLDERTTNLSETILTLVERTEALQKESQRQGSQIIELQVDLTEQARVVSDLGKTERRNFSLSAAAVMLVAILVSVFYGYQQDENRLVAAQVAETTELVDGAISGLETKLQQEQQRSEQLVQALSLLNNRLEDKSAENNRLAAKVELMNNQLSAVDKSVRHLDDQAQSLNGRLSSVLFFDDFGGDNVLHGSQWLTELPADKFLIQLAIVKDKKELFEIVQDYNRYLKQPVAYYADEAGHFVMVYGTFDSGRSAYSELRNMPSRINWQKPVVRTVESVQQLISL